MATSVALCSLCTCDRRVRFFFARNPMKLVKPSGSRVPPKISLSPWCSEGCVEDSLSGISLACSYQRDPSSKSKLCSYLYFFVFIFFIPLKQFIPTVYNWRYDMIGIVFTLLIIIFRKVVKNGHEKYNNAVGASIERVTTGDRRTT